ncbi:MAG: UDP-N-acetylglucosamine--N-acetylmuramyl-(pentapeptide) pyrophosphoryl-undecaprenol N-acetylglucosamine transferase [Verrucomicrobia bacterium]|nr:UDP-N-acetylglucosamine--N-acetylmuramyl-(pentapeptide) pyrophosphoryl-undecaprenol N-acetylglucosamine transferase [Verrucomicrobiota bacterium]
MSRFLISCGGTGGHLAPGIALAEELQRRGHQVRLLISRKQVDARLAEKYPQLVFEPVASAGLDGGVLGMARFGLGQLRALVAGWRRVRRERPAAVIGFGGFTSVGPAVAGWLLGVPVVLHEANRVPGRAVRVLGRLARRVYLPPGVALRSARRGAVRESGLPLRREFRREPVEGARRTLGLLVDRPVVVVLGGSQGASALNTWARGAAAELAESGIQLYCLTGLGKGAAEVRPLRDREGGEVRVIEVPFSDRMATVLSAADLAVSRAGAGTIAELVRTETPAVLVPYPQAADNHQTANAVAFVQDGGGRQLPQGRLVELTAVVRTLLADPQALAAHRAALRSQQAVDAAAVLANDLESIAASRPRPAAQPGMEAV